MVKDRIAFFGSPLLAHRCLQELHRTFHIALVVTQPDREKGRGRHVSMTPVKGHALEVGIPVYQSPDLGEGLLSTLSEQGITLIVVVAFGRILARQIIDFPEHGSLNLHASMLPKYRGASPIEAAILGGEGETGITLQHMAVEMDRGAILDAERVLIEEGWTAEQLHDRIVQIAPAFLSRSVKYYLDGKLEAVRQDEASASYCKPIRKSDGSIDWQEDAVNICRKIRAYNMWPVACSSIQGKGLKIYNAQTLPSDRDDGGELPVGQVIGTDNVQGIIVKTGKGCLGITDLQMENKRRMHHREFLNGYRNLAGVVLGTQ
jgi:methionyl-tRNA formyltransferase